MHFADAHAEMCGTVAKVHPDGTVDVLLPSGEVLERMPADGVERAEDAERPVSAASSRPSTSNTRIAKDRPSGGLLAQSEPQACDASSFEPILSTIGRSLASGKDQCGAPEHNGLGTTDLALIEAGISRRGGRKSLSAARAAQSEMPSLLSWE